MTFAIALSFWLAAVAPQPAARLQVVYPNAAFDGTCTLIWSDGTDTERVLYFLTSLRFFRNSQGTPYLPTAAVRIVLDDGRSFEVPREGVILPMGSLIDIAILRVTTPTAAVEPNPVNFDGPSPETVFSIAGHDRDGTPVTIPQHARSVSTRLIVGDRDASTLNGCLGAPALVDGGIIGIVSSCEPGRAPIITLLSAASLLLDRAIPGLFARPTLREQGARESGYGFATRARSMMAPY
jgi:hypothetical protein